MVVSAAMTTAVFAATSGAATGGSAEVDEGVEGIHNITRRRFQRWVEKKKRNGTTTTAISWMRSAAGACEF